MPLEHWPIYEFYAIFFAAGFKDCLAAAERLARSYKTFADYLREFPDEKFQGWRNHVSTYEDFSE